MSYFYNKKIFKEYLVDGTIYAGNGDIIKEDFIEIFNNEKMIFDFSNLVFKCSDLSVTGVELNKIKIDWGDGNTNTLTKELKHKGNTINNKGQSWKRIEHVYNTDKRNIYLTDEVNALPKITIHLYNTYNDVVKIIIPFKLIYKTIYDLNCNFDIMSANVTNNNLTSFVLKENNNESISVVQTKSWKQQNEGEDIVYITDTSVSNDYSNDFVNEDSIIWDWAAIPQVDLKTKRSSTINIGGKLYTGFLCSFTEKTVNIETWNPKVYKLLDAGDFQLQNINYPPNTKNTFSIVGGTKGKPSNIDSGVYKIYLNLTGINDVTGDTTPFYISGNSQFKPVEKIGSYTITNNTLDKTFSYNLSENAQWKHIKSGKMTLTPIKIDESDSGIGKDYNTADKHHVFEYDLIKNNNGTKIALKALPNGTYGIKYDWEDILGNKSSISGSSNLKWEYVDIATSISFTKISNNVSDFQWKISSPSEMDKVGLEITNVNTGETFINTKKMYDQWDYKKTENNYDFTYKISPEKIPDGTYTVTAKHCIDMIDYVGERRKEISKSWNYTYNVPKITISNCKPHMIFNLTNKRWYPYAYVDVSYTSDDYPTDIKLLVDEISFPQNKKEIHSSITKKIDKLNKYIYSFTDLGLGQDDVNKKLEIYFKCRDLRDNILKREQKNPKTFIICRNDKKFDKSITSIPNTPENINLNENYTSGGTTLTGVDVVNESAVDVYRTHANASRTLFAGSPYPTFFSKLTANQNNDGTYTTTSTPLYSYFALKTYTSNANEKFNRYIQSNNWNENTLEALPTVKNYFKNDTSSKVSTSSKYDKWTDTSKLTITSTISDTAEQIMHAGLKLYNVLDKNTPVYQGDLRHDIKNFSIDGLNLGQYYFTIDYSSINTNNVSSTIYTHPKFNIYANQDDVIKAKVSKTQINETNSYSITFSWELYYKSAKNLKLYYKEINVHTSFQSIELKNEEKYFNPSHYFTKGNKVQFYFTLDGDYITYNNDKNKKIPSDWETNVVHTFTV